MNAEGVQAESLSQRELRNESGRVLRAVSEGHSFVLTNRGVPVGRIVPLDAPAPRLTIARPAKRVGGWTARDRRPSSDNRVMTEIIDELREERL
ncbi:MULTISPECIES: type II toxin-antitoxin system Phd/YefM family antitoxin [Brevibacterium]|jgi:prevent-host-death family protein|uniref:Type II toxin-antitoxin system prevent-host-death family antitoxin n=1 Tax=Brevibacterium casei TaxID=33889 RepID=A0A7T3ZZX2_9MICO|nr:MULTISPECIES: type II toxin-antitoxin system prevent-host-death family antitoxin [Brevibacterium]QQB14731.1 type II toxin-antitoxin system prevent-host-death family antitoxin [Brevibacterium casei]